MAFLPRHRNRMRQRPRADIRAAPNRSLHALEDLARHAAQTAVQFAAVAEAWVDEVDDHDVGARQAVDELTEEEREQQFGGVVAVAGAEVALVVQDADGARVLLLGELEFFGYGPLRDFAADDAEDGGGVRRGGAVDSMAVGGGAGAGVLGLEDGTEEQCEGGGP